MDNVFDIILDKDEQIVEIFKPNKKKAYFGTLFLSIILGIFIFGFWFIGAFIPDENGFVAIDLIYPAIIPVVLFAIYMALTIVFMVMHYKKTFYAYTNKRVLIRTGTIGVDFRTLDLKSIGALDVNVSFLDKIVKKNTGTIKFGNMSNPMSNQTQPFSFMHIENPYEVYKRIKEYKESAK